MGRTSSDFDADCASRFEWTLSMTVAELIEKLQRMPQESMIVVPCFHKSDYHVPALFVEEGVYIEDENNFANKQYWMDSPDERAEWDVISENLPAAVAISF